jgi:aminoglycoside phosphotransferase (APT) family kinase protein
VNAGTDTEEPDAQRHSAEDGDGPMLRSVAAAVEKTGLTDLTPVGGGLEFRVWRARHPEWGDVVLRAARSRFESNDNDPLVDTGALLRREARLSTLLASAGLPVPRHFRILAEEVDVSVNEFVAADATPFRSHELGSVVARLHSLGEAQGLEPPEDASASFAVTIAERLCRRWSVLHAIDPGLPKLPSEAELASLVPADFAPSLLHLDLRAANLLVRDGSIHAVIDWSNSMAGDPALELARVAEYARLPENGLDYADFVHGYTSVRQLPRCSADCWAFYRLDAAAMLAVVFNSEAPDPERGAETLRWLDTRASIGFPTRRGTE